MARPCRQNGIVTPRTPAELRVIRERGHRDFVAALAESKKKDNTTDVAIIQEVTKLSS